MAEEKVEKKVSKVLSEAEMDRITLTTKEQLEKQPKKSVRIPKSRNPKDPNYETVQINGYTYQIMKGHDVLVPEEVYNILVRAGII